MPKICYQTQRFKPETLNLLAKADKVLTEYADEGYSVTLRQLYYYFVAHDLFPEDWKYSRVPGSGDKWRKDPENGTNNCTPNYKNFGNVLNDGRMAGYIDWDHLVDKGRNLETYSSWNTPGDIINSAAASFRMNPWVDQPWYVETWVEKDALLDVVSKACDGWRVPHFACKGYTSQSEAWSAGQRLKRILRTGKKVLIIHLGDHDPSGIDMTRDVTERLKIFAESSRIEVDRIALNMDQIQHYDPPPNPTKMTDSRANDYVDRFGDDCWELDALDIRVIRQLVDERIRKVVDKLQFSRVLDIEQNHRSDLAKVSRRWDKVADYIKKLK